MRTIFLKARFIICLNLLCLTVSVNAQTWKWAQSTGNSGNESIGLATDQNRNNYNCGSFSGTVTFGSTSLTSAGGYDAYLTKTDENGAFLWAVKLASGIGDDRTASVVCDPSGTDIYVVGHFTGTSTFGGTTTLISSGGYDAYIAKYNSSGTFQWVKHIAGSGSEESRDAAWSRCIGFCKGTYIYVTGNFSGSTDFGGTTLTPVGGGTNIFTAAYNMSGTLLWVKQASSSSNAITSNAIAVDRSTNSVYITGGLYGTGTYGSLSLSSPSGWDQFVLKYNSSGTEQWVKQGAGNYYDEGKDICVDASGNVYVGGTYASTSLSFGSYSLTTAGADDVSLVKYNSSGTEQWAKSAGGIYSDYLGEMTVDPVGNVYITGDFSSTTMTFGTMSLSRDAGWDLFIARISPSGTFNQVASAVGSVSYADMHPTALTVSDLGHVTVSGNFTYSFTFGSTIITAPSGQYGFMAKLRAGAWPVVAGSTGIDQIFNMEVDAAGNTYVSGMYGGYLSLGNGVNLPAPTAPVPAPQNAFVIKYNTMGQAEWARYGAPTTYWGGNACAGEAVTCDASGNVYMAGEYIDNTTFGSTTLIGSRACYLVKYNSSGTQQWALRIADASSGTVQPSDMTTDASGNIYITGAYYTSATFYGSPNVTLTGAGAFIAKFNSSGILQWAVNACSDGEGNSIALNGTDIFVAGSFGSGGTVTFGSPTVTATSAGVYDMFIAKYNSSGVGQAVIAAGSTASDYMHQVASYGSDIYVTGKYQGSINFGGTPLSSGGSNYDGMLAKINAGTMTVSWIREVKGTSVGECKGVAVNGNGVFVSGEFLGTGVFGDGTIPINITSAGSSDVYLERFDHSGNYQWVKTIGGTNNDRNIGAGIDANGNGYVSGNFVTSTVIAGTNYNSSGSDDFFVHKMAANNGVHARFANEQTSNEATDTRIPDNIRIYPNPSTGNITIDFGDVLPKEIMVYDMTGRLIIHSADNANQLSLDLSSQPRGIYILMINVGEKQFFEKLIKE